jgi:hypothetical protein
MKSAHEGPSLWVSVVFYVSILTVLVVTLLVAAKVLPVFVLPIVLLDGILTLSIVGAVQLQQDDQLGQKNFLELMVLTFKYLPWLRKRDE